MLKKLLVVTILTYIFSIVQSRYKDYSIYSKFVVKHVNNDVYEHMVEMQQTIDRLDFWQLTKNISVVLVPPKLERVFQQRMNNIGAPYNASLLENDELYCGDECPKVRQSRQQGGFFKFYQRYNTILQFMHSLSKKYPNLVRFESLGRSVEGRRIGMICVHPNKTRGNKMVYIQGGAHSREWIAPTTVLYFINELLTNYKQYQELLKGIEICVVPVLNPDGYEISHTYNRFWRKNRHRTHLRDCTGVDLNRNYGYYWNTVGASLHPCSEVYAGRGPFSEPETQAVRYFLEQNRYKIKLALDIHSYGGYIFYPWGYRTGEPPTKNFLHSVAVKAADAMSKYRGTNYQVGTSAELLYAAAGGFDDYAYGVLGIPLAYTMELPGTKFDISSNEIIPTGKETFSGFIEMIKVVSVI